MTKIDDAHAAKAANSVVLDVSLCQTVWDAVQIAKTVSSTPVRLRLLHLLLECSPYCYHSWVFVLLSFRVTC